MSILSVDTRQFVCSVFRVIWASAVEGWRPHIATKTKTYLCVIRNFKESKSRHSLVDTANRSQNCTTNKQNVNWDMWGYVTCATKCKNNEVWHSRTGNMNTVDYLGLRNQSWSGVFGRFKPSNCDKFTKSEAEGQVFGEFVTVTGSEHSTSWLVPILTQQKISIFVLNCLAFWQCIIWEYLVTWDQTLQKRLVRGDQIRVKSPGVLVSFINSSHLNVALVATWWHRSHEEVILFQACWNTGTLIFIECRPSHAMGKIHQALVQTCWQWLVYALLTQDFLIEFPAKLGRLLKIKI